MIRQFLGLTALLGLGVEAFMIPSTMSLPDIESDNLPSISDLIPTYEASSNAPKSVKVEDYNAFSNSVAETISILPIPEDPEIRLSTGDRELGIPDFLLTNIECLSCGLWPGELAEATSFEPSKVSLVFNIDSTGEKLLLNTVPLYPLGDIAPVFMAHEKSSTAFFDARMPSHELDYQAAIAAGPIDSQTGDQLLDIWLRVTGIDGVEANVKPLKIKIVKTPEGQLSLLKLSFDSEMPNESLGPEEASEEDCTGPAIFCKLFNIFETKISSWRSKLHSLKPCHRFKGESLEGTTLPTLHGGIPKFTLPPLDGSVFQSDALEGDDTYRHHHHHHIHHHHERLHAFVQGVRDFLVGFLIPVLIGIMAGMLASLVGMVLGSFVAWAWIRFVRKGKRGPYAPLPTSNDDAEKSASVDSERVVEGESEDFAPPAYVEKA